MNNNDSFSSSTNDLLKHPSVLINEALQNIQNKIKGHGKTHILYTKYDRSLGYPIAILSIFISYSMLLNVNDNPDLVFPLELTGLTLGIIMFILSISREYLRFSKKAYEHDISCKLYTDLLRNVEIRLINGFIDIKEKQDLFRDMSMQMNTIEQYELRIPKRIMRKIEANPPISRSVGINKFNE